MIFVYIPDLKTFFEKTDQSAQSNSVLNAHLWPFGVEVLRDNEVALALQLRYITLFFDVDKHDVQMLWKKRN